MSIGVQVRYKDERGEVYWPYLTQRHLTDFIWPLAKEIGLWRLELLEVLDYESLKDLLELKAEMVAFLNHIEQNSSTIRYESLPHVFSRTNELIARLDKAIAEWTAVAGVDFF